MKLKNIFNLPFNLDNEFIETLAEGRSFRLERIVSKGHTTASRKWYDQHEDELVILLSGEAEIMYDDMSCDFLLKGDILLIPAHKKHIITYTSENPECVWLALFFHERS